MHDPETQICSFPSYQMRQWMESKRWLPRWLSAFELFTLWHVDPCRRGGGDDSCGWFKRAHHGKPEVLAKIVKEIEFDFDRVFKSDSGKVYFSGYFYPEDAGAGMPNMGVSAIALNFFFLAALKHFGSRAKAVRFCQRHLFEILIFAENPTDSLRDSIVRKFGMDTKREERIRAFASCVYGWILRADQKWWQHPRWHVHHWRIQIHLWQIFKRWAFVRCAHCGGRFRWNEAVCTSWQGGVIWHSRCESQPPVRKQEQAI